MNLAAENALSRQHQQQRFVFNALWELPIGHEERVKIQNAAWLARIFSRIQAAPIFTVENAIHTPGIVTMGFRILKYFPFGEWTGILQSV